MKEPSTMIDGSLVPAEVSEELDQILKSFEVREENIHWMIVGVATAVSFLFLHEMEVRREQPFAALVTAVIGLFCVKIGKLLHQRASGQDLQTLRPHLGAILASMKEDVLQGDGSAEEKLKGLRDVLEQAEDALRKPVSSQEFPEFY